jgi:hypothetical protein
MAHVEADFVLCPCLTVSPPTNPTKWLAKLAATRFSATTTFLTTTHKLDASSTHRASSLHPLHEGHFTTQQMLHTSLLPQGW